MQYSFVVEHYQDESETLHQSIEIPCAVPKEYYHRYASFIRTQINPHLKWLHEIWYLDKNRKILYIEKYNIDGHFIKREEPWMPDLDNNKHKYSSGLI